MQPPLPMQVYRFRNCLLNTAERAVIRDGQYLDLTTKTFDVLQLLVENAGNIVSKDELLGTVWNGNFVEESNLPVHISKLRKILGHKQDTRLIETVQGIGYRFVAPVQQEDPNVWNYTVLKQRSSQLSGQGGLGLRNSFVAVLPLKNETGVHGNEFLSDGLTEGLINGLSHVPGLKIIARDTVFHYKTTELGFRDIAAVLGVSILICGRIRLVGDRTVIAIELIKGSDGTQIWGGQFDRPSNELMSLEQMVISSITDKLSNEITVAKGGGSLDVENEESYRHYLMGRYIVEQKRSVADIQEALGHFTRASRCLSTKILANVAIVECYSLLYRLDHYSRNEALNQIQPIIESLFHLQQEGDLLLLMQARLQLYFHWNVAGATRHVETALRLNPNLVGAHAFYASLLAAAHRTDEARMHATQVLDLDPMSIVSWQAISRAFYLLGEHRLAIDYLSAAVRMDPNNFETLLLLGANHTEIEEYDSALAAFERSYRLQPTAEALSMIGHVLGRSGEIEQANAIIRGFTSEDFGRRCDPVNLARIYVATGDRQSVYRCLNQALAEHAMELWALDYDPRWRALRSEGAFRKLVSQVQALGASVDRM